MRKLHSTVLRFEYVYSYCMLRDKTGYDRHLVWILSTINKSNVTELGCYI